MSRDLATTTQRLSLAPMRNPHLISESLFAFMPLTVHHRSIAEGPAATDCVGEKEWGSGSIALGAEDISGAAANDPRLAEIMAL